MTELKIEKGQSQKVGDLEIKILEIEEPGHVKFSVNQEGTIVRFGGGQGDKFTAFKRIFEVKEIEKSFSVFEVIYDNK
ncbi:MAG: hypothetical protein JW891_01590 [Candidatus Lokiarchaeota archaeon]|nr:hypothetical protein [Candidatus Lokiarchaeota archaeon]